ncbi:DUF305 domain-containing protein [Nocardia sp. NBC_00508]|uniref:DUF305 domain-containing protein n=1 Tax=Nocardia sp. NBC_00508 TaxID=2975992 RepID=UPI002E81C709|nr:DUF305 domain-containing protein [Nocardia sp. NBC_00508]WUD64131.1 DUF305 domain-containing protein [Nocardia sp. NBC_00508]
MFITPNRLAIAVATAAALSLAGCGDADTGHTTEHGTSTTANTSAPARAEHNDADVTFLQMMYPHHAQAVEMARLVPGHTDNQQLRALAASIEQAQAPEMQQITALLQSFGQPAPTMGEEHQGHDMPSTPMPGLMSAEQLAALQAASGPDFDRQWMTMMIEHHTGAIAMAETELADGMNSDAQALARAIISAQKAEIDQMRTMLGQN